MRKFYGSGYQHICQKTVDNGLIFLSPIDFVVFASIVGQHCFAVGLSVVAFCIMFNHIHLAAAFLTRRQMDAFMNGVISAFARMYNRRYRRGGKLFHRPYQSSAKFTDKKARETIIYINNNPVEKSMVTTARNYRWNFLRYLESPHPFSEPIDLSVASHNLTDLMNEVKVRKFEGKSLNYKMFDVRYHSLTTKEQEQFIDFCVSEYLALDREAILNKYGSIDKMYEALDSVMGSEYDLCDDDGQEDYRHYCKMSEILNDEGYPVDRMRISADNEDFPRLESRFRREAHASDYEIGKYFHR